MVQFDPQEDWQRPYSADPERCARSRWLLTVRIGSATVATGLYAIWWLHAATLPAERHFLVWAAALLMWGLALFSAWTVPRWNRSTTWAMLLIAVAAVPRSLSLSLAPYLVTLDEAIHPFYGQEVLHQRPWDLMSGVSSYFSTPVLTQALQAWPCLFLDPLLGTRVASVVLALLSLWSVYALGVRLFGPFAGLLALLVLSSSYWHMAFARMGYPYVQPILAVPLTLHVLLLGVERRHPFLQFLGGVLLGLTVLLYTPARIVIPVFAVWWLHRLVMGKLGWWEGVRAGATIALGAALLLTPYLRSQGIAGMFSRYQDTALAPQGPLHLLHEYGWTSAAGRELLAKQVRAAAAVYYQGGAWLAVHDYSPAPLLDPVALGLALAGLALALLRPRDHRTFLLVVWVAATFVSGQVLTDVPQAAYRAAPLLPALAVCVALSVSTLTDAVARWAPRRTGWIRGVAFCTVAVAIVPPNLRALQQYLQRRASNEWIGMARLIGAGEAEPIYYIVSSRPMAESEVFCFLGRDRTMRDVPSLEDVLGRTIDPSRPAMFVIDPSMAGAATAIRRCYPGAVPWAGPCPPGPRPVTALYVPAEAVASGHDCGVATDGPGLRARYFRGSQWDDEVVLERVEDWPVRWMTQTEAAQFRSVEWTGSVRAPVPGTYRFQFSGAVAQGTATIGELQLGADENGSATLSPGVYPVRLRCAVQPGGFCWLRWAPPFADFEIIPAEFLTPSGG